MKEFDEDTVHEGKFNLELYKRGMGILDRYTAPLKKPCIKGYGVGFTNDGFYLIIDIDPADINQLDIGDELEGAPVYWRDHRKLLRTT